MFFFYSAFALISFFFLFLVFWITPRKVIFKYGTCFKCMWNRAYSCSVAQHLFMIYFPNERYCYDNFCFSRFFFFLSFNNIFFFFYTYCHFVFPLSFPWPSRFPPQIHIWFCCYIFLKLRTTGALIVLLLNFYFSAKQ